MRKLLWILLFLCALPCSATTYYVRTDGNDTYCTGQTDVAAPYLNPSACAFQTIQKGLDTVAAGDTLTIHEGTYFETPTITTSGTPGNVITIQGAPGETVVVDFGGVTEARVAGNSDWTLIDADLGEYRSTFTLPSGKAFVHGFVTDIPNHESGNVYLNSYSDRRAATDLACSVADEYYGRRCSSDSGCGGVVGSCTLWYGPSGLANFRSTSMTYVDPSTALYVGPGTWLEKTCVGGSNDGGLCDLKSDDENIDCPGGGVCTANGYVRIRLAKTPEFSAFEDDYGTIFWNDPEDPRNHALMLSTRDVGFTIGGSYITVQNMTFNVAGKNIRLDADPAAISNIVLDDITVWVGSRGIAAGLSEGDGIVSDVTISNSRIYGPYAYWISWTDYQDLPNAAGDLSATCIDMRRGAHDWEIHHNHIRGCGDGVGTNNCEYNVDVHHNRFDNQFDDAFEIEAASLLDDPNPCPTPSIGGVNMYENYIENSYLASAVGQATYTSTGDIRYYRNVIAQLRDHFVNRKENTRTFNGGFRYGRQYTWKTHSYDVTPSSSPHIFYYHNTVVLSNSSSKGINVVPKSAFGGVNADTRVFGNLFVKVSGTASDDLLTSEIGGPLNTDGTKMLNYNTYHIYNKAGESVLDDYDTLAAACAAEQWECNGTEGDAGFATFLPTFDKSVSTRWTITPQWAVGHQPQDFQIRSTSAARNAATGAGLGDGKSGTLPDSRASQVDAGAIPYGTADEWTGVFPFDQAWVSNPPIGRATGVTAYGMTYGQ